MKKMLLTATALCGAVMSLWAVPSAERELELKQPFYQPTRHAKVTDFKIILLYGGKNDVEDHILVIAPDGKVTLIDTGICTAWPELTKAFNRYGIKHIDQVIITHLHGDHIGGLPAILPMKAYTFGKVMWELLPDKNLTDEGPAEAENNRIRIQQVKERSAARKIPIEEIKQGQVIDFGSGATGTVLLTCPKEMLGVPTLNNTSIIIRFQYGNFSMLFTGDMCIEEAAILMKSGADIHCDVLKTAHHGGAYGTNPALLKAVAPKAAVSPMPEWLSKDQRGLDTDKMMHDAGIAHYRNWEFQETGELVVATDGKEFFITPYGKEETVQ